MVVIEVILLDLTEILENLDMFDDARLYFEQYSPILIGKHLRNSLAHGDAYLETFPLSSIKCLSSATLTN